MKEFLENAMGALGGSFAIVFFAVGQFPGGTILMAMSCDTNRLDGWAWVLSVVIPFFGFFTAFFSSYC